MDDDVLLRPCYGICIMYFQNSINMNAKYTIIKEVQGNVMMTISLDNILYYLMNKWCTMNSILNFISTPTIQKFL